MWYSVSKNHLAHRFYRLCPLGSAQDWLGRLKVAKIRLPSQVRILKHLILAVVIAIVIFMDKFPVPASYGKLLLYGFGFIIVLQSIFITS